METPSQDATPNWAYWMFGSFIVIIIAIAAIGSRSTPQVQAPVVAVKTPEEIKAQEEAKAKAFFVAMTPAQHLDYIDYVLGGKQVWVAQVDEATKHLAAIPEAAPEYRKSKALITKATTKIEKAHLMQAIEQRRVFAWEYESQMLDRGFNFHVTTEGKNATTLKIKWALTNRVTAHALGQNRHFWRQTYDVGFEKVVMTNGFQSDLYETYSWNPLLQDKE